MSRTTIRWGIISTGSIARKFVKDLLVDPKTRQVDDVAHVVAAIGSRSVEKAQEFIDTVAGGDKNIKAYGSYEQVYTDETVDAIYIGTPHTYHFENALDAIKAKKHVLCEKPVTSNGLELRALLEAAKANGVFFMEAVWTRFHPLSLAVKEVVDSGVLGLPVVLHADLSGNFDIKNIPTTHRILDPALGGGALLDLGPYPLVWAIMALFEHPANKLFQPSKITGTMLMTPITNVDRNAAFVVTFNEADLSAQAILSCSINIDPHSPGVSIRFEKGTIKIATPIFCPKSFTIEVDGKEPEKKEFEYVGGGWHYQADEVARCVRDGKLESSLWGHNKSLLEMDIFDEVRKQGGYVFPPGVEKVVKLP